MFLDDIDIRLYKGTRSVLIIGYSITLVLALMLHVSVIFSPIKNVGKPRVARKKLRNDIISNNKPFSIF